MDVFSRRFIYLLVTFRGADIMCVRVLLVVCSLLVSSVQCSSIITRSMIRMPENPSFADETGVSWLPQPEKLKSNSNSHKYEIIYPLKSQNNTVTSAQSKPLESKAISSTSQENVLGSNLQNKFSVNDSKKNISKQENEFTLRTEAWHSNHEMPTKQHSTGKFFQINSKISPQELSNRYWEHYKNFSYDYFNNSGVLQGSVNDSTNDEGFGNPDVWEVLQRIYSCVWSSGIMSCLQESFGDLLTSESFSFLQLPSPSTQPRFHQEGNSTGDFSGNNDKYDFVISDEDEGRKKLSKKLQLILPLLMVLKMTMLPALAVMALVSGKAFLMSLLSLGVALVAASIQPATLGANKRHEIASQAQIPTDRLPNNYYYVM